MGTATPLFPPVPTWHVTGQPYIIHQCITPCTANTNTTTTTNGKLYTENPFYDRIPVGTRFSACPDRPWGPPSLLYNGYRVFPGGKVRPGRAADHSPPSTAAVMEE